MRDPFGKLVSFTLGAVLVAVFGTLGIDAWRDYRAFNDTPTRSTLRAAIEASMSGRRWVSVEGAVWRCEDLVHNVKGGAAFLPASAEDGSTVVARFDRPIQCNALITQPLTGIIEPMTLERAADLRAGGLELLDGAQLRTLDVCAFCGKNNARLGMIVCACFVLVGLALYPLWRTYLSWRARALSSLHAAIDAPSVGTAKANRVVRAWGGALLVVCAAAFPVSEGWAVYGVVPARWVAALGAVLGTWMIAFPEKYRRLAARARGR